MVPEAHQADLVLVHVRVRVLVEEEQDVQERIFIILIFKLKRLLNI